MENCDCKKGIACNAAGVLVGLIIGTIFAVISILLAPLAIGFVIISLIFSAIAFLVLVASLFTANIVKCYTPIEKCICSNAKCLLIGSIGTFITSTVSLTFGIILIPIISAIVIGILAFFFTLTLIGLISFVKCLIKGTCRKCEDYN